VQLTRDTSPLVGNCLTGPGLSLPLGLDQAGSDRVAADPDESGDAEPDQHCLRVPLGG
jgi:hypothetical protein